MRKLWNFLLKVLDDIDSDTSPNSEYTNYKGENVERHWCPFCGYSGTSDNVRCYLLNSHKK